MGIFSLSRANWQRIINITRVSTLVSYWGLKQQHEDSILAVSLKFSSAASLWHWGKYIEQGTGHRVAHVHPFFYRRRRQARPDHISTLIVHNMRHNTTTIRERQKELEIIIDSHSKGGGGGQFCTLPRIIIATTKQNARSRCIIINEERRRTTSGTIKRTVTWMTTRPESSLRAAEPSNSRRPSRKILVSIIGLTVSWRAA